MADGSSWMVECQGLGWMIVSVGGCWMDEGEWGSWMSKGVGWVRVLDESPWVSDGWLWGLRISWLWPSWRVDWSVEMDWLEICKCLLWRIRWMVECRDRKWRRIEWNLFYNKDVNFKFICRLWIDKCRWWNLRCTIPGGSWRVELISSEGVESDIQQCKWWPIRV